MICLIGLCSIYACTKDGDTSLFIKQSTRTATLSFGAYFTIDEVTGLKKENKERIPECLEITPIYLEVVLKGATNVGSLEEPMVLKINANTNGIQKDENSGAYIFNNAELKLEPGKYTLEYFAVFSGNPEDADSKLLWKAPSKEGEFANFVESSLPLEFDLKTGRKQIVEVGVLCYDRWLSLDEETDVLDNEGFQIQSTRAIDFCVFGSYCDEIGRSYVAKYKISGWLYSGDPIAPKGKLLFSNRENVISTDENNDSSDISSAPLCIQLPDTNGEDLYYLEITILPLNYNTAESIIRKGVISDVEVKTLFKENKRISPYHFREGYCNMNDTPSLFQ